MDIKHGAGYPASSLTNLAPHKFTLDGVNCGGMEGFLQALKFKDIPMQEYVCSLGGMAAKQKGSAKDWKKKQVLYWRGVEYRRNSIEYQELLNKAYTAMYEQSLGFRKALEASKGATLTHSIGKKKKSDTVITVQEFISRITKLRDYGKLS